MTEETRRSGRANKGHHTKHRDGLDEPSPAPPKSTAKASGKPDKKAPDSVKGGKKGQAVRAPSTPPPEADDHEEEEVAAGEEGEEEDEEEEEEEDAVIRCVCGEQRDIRGRQMICCDTCEAWQHNKCLGLPEGDFWDGKDYYCEKCNPQDHVDLLAAMARGEKPWARKKGSKPKSRPSDVKHENMSDKATSPQHSATPSQSAAAPAEPATPTPAPAANGQTDSVSDTKSQPQSPAGEKRRYEPSAEKANASKKRRKSSHPDAKTSTQSGPVDNMDALPQNQKALAEKLCEILTPLINTASDARGYRIPDGQTARSLATQFTLQISHAAFTAYGEPSGTESPYFAKIRTIMFNVKKNTVLVDRLLSGSLKAQDFVRMEAEEMASEDKQREYAAMREAAEKQAILTEEAGPRLRKTHKGEEIVGEEDSETHEFKQPSLRERESITEDTVMQSPVGSRPPQSPASATRYPPSADTLDEQAEGARRASTNFDINSVFNKVRSDKVRSPQQDQHTFLQRRTSSMQIHDKSHAAVDDEDVDRLLKDDDNDADMSGYSTDPTVCWQGSIQMQSMQPFDAVARFVAGGDFGQIVPWEKLLTNALAVQGRIESAKGNDYIQGIANTESHEVAILSVSPVTTEGRTVLDHLYNYFHSRGRWGVVPVDTAGNGILRDLYVIPIESGASNLPPFIDMLEYCTIETPRKEHMLILALIAKLPDVKPPQLPPPQHLEAFPPQDSTPVSHSQQTLNGPSPSPVPNPHAPQFSPVAPGFPQAPYGNAYAHPQPTTSAPPFPLHQPLHQYPQHQQPIPPLQPPPPHHQMPHAREIFGPYIDAPVIVTILSSNLSQNQVVSELQMINLRHIVEHIPEARTDFNVLSNHLRIKTDGNSGTAHANGTG